MSFYRCEIDKMVRDVDRVLPPVINVDMYTKEEGDGDINSFARRLNNLISDAKDAIDHYANLYRVYKSLAEMDEKHVRLLGYSIKYIAEKEHISWDEAYKMADIASSAKKGETQ